MYVVLKVCVFVFEDSLLWKKGKLKEHANLSHSFSLLGFLLSVSSFHCSFPHLSISGGRSQSFSGMLISPCLCPLGDVGKGLDLFSCIPGAYQLTKLAWDNALLLAPVAAFFPSFPFCFLHPWLIWDRSFIRGGEHPSHYCLILACGTIWFSTPVLVTHILCPDTDEISFANRLLGSSASQTFVGIFHNVGLSFFFVLWYFPLQGSTISIM